MRNLGRVSAILGTLAGVSAVLAFSVAGCGGDDNVIGPDAKQDTTSDHTMPDSPHTDGKHKDAPPDDVRDSGKGDAPPDVLFFDVNDAMVFDVPDVKITDAAFEVSLAEYPAAVNKAYCERLATCCAAAADGGIDAGSFVADCVGVFAGSGPIGNLGLANTSSPNVTYIASNAKTCLEQMTILPCGSETATQTELNTVTCASAIRGNLANGKGPCTSSFDCTTGYCPTDGGLCTPLAALGSPCNDTTFSTDCTYLGNGEPLVYCDTDSGTCKNDIANGSSCFEYQECQSQLCVFTTVGVCGTTFNFTDPGTCAAF